MVTQLEGVSMKNEGNVSKNLLTWSYDILIIQNFAGTLIGEYFYLFPIDIPFVLQEENAT